MYPDVQQAGPHGPGAAAPTRGTHIGNLASAGGYSAALMPRRPSDHRGARSLRQHAPDDDELLPPERGLAATIGVRLDGLGVRDACTLGLPVISSRASAVVSIDQRVLEDTSIFGRFGSDIVVGCPPLEGPMTEARKLAAILVADVVGYSRLAGADEDRTLARLRALRSDLIDPTIALHHGRIVKRTGDGIIIEFRSVVDAVRCAIEVQTGMVERNAGLPPERRIEFRVGIHLGDIVEESDGDLMGDGVNIAARLEGICEPGGICLSEDAYRHVRDRLKENFVDLGEKQLKNIARPVRGYALTPAAINGAQVAKPATTFVTRKSGVSAVQTAVAAAVALALMVTGWLGWRTWSLPRESQFRGLRSTTYSRPLRASRSSCCRSKI